MMQTPDYANILCEVDKIIAHKIFNRSPLMCAFLTYITRETLQCRESRISAYSVAVDALNKSSDFDPQVDPSVRVLAKRLRDSLTRYYNETTDCSIIVILEPGSYVPKFQFTEQILESACSTSTSGTTSNSSWSEPVLIYDMIDTNQKKG